MLRIDDDPVSGSFASPAPGRGAARVTATLAQRTVYEDGSRVSLALPLGPVLGKLHPGGVFPLVEDPGPGVRSTIVGMMVLRPADHAWNPAGPDSRLPDALREVEDWCYDVAGVGGSWPVSGANALDAFRLALQYGTMDAVLAGSATVAREGLVAGARPGHLWQPYTPLSWAPLRPHREWLEPAIAAVRREWQQRGVLSGRRYPAQVAISASGRVAEGQPDLLDARMFHDRHPDGSPMEAWVLTSEAGADRLRARARARGSRVDDLLLVCSPPGRPEEIDVAGVPLLLRGRLDARLVEHDGGARSLEAFLAAGAVAQLHLTLMRRRSVRDVLGSSERLDVPERERILATWSGRARLFPRTGAFPRAWRLFYAVAEEQPAGEALVACLDVRERQER